MTVSHDDPRPERRWRARLGLLHSSAVLAVAIAAWLATEPAQASGRTAQAAETSRLAPSVEVGRLGAIDPDAVGTLTPATGGFAFDVWQGSTLASIAPLLARVPLDATSPAMAEMLRRLLLSAAAPPKGEAEPGSFLAARARLLLARGELDDVGELLGAAPPAARTPDVLLVELDARLLAFDNAGACSLAGRRISGEASVEWQKAFVFCQALAGRHDEALLGADLLADLGADDAVFESLLATLAGSGARGLDSVPDASPLVLAMARAAGLQLPAEVLNTATPGVLRAIAVSPNAPLGVRLAAAEAAHAAAALPVETLRQLYLTPAILETTTAVGEAESDGDQPGLLGGYYRQALQAESPHRVAAVLAEAFAAARRSKRYLQAVGIFQDLAAGLPPDIELASFAPEAVRALLIAGAEESVAAWFAMLRANAATNSAARGALVGLTPTALLIGAAVDGSGSEVLDRWWSTLGSDEDALARRRVASALVDDAGIETPTGWQRPQAAETGLSLAETPELDPRHRLAEATENGRAGEAVLAVLVVLGREGGVGADPARLAAVLDALRRIGLAAEARMLAIELAAAAGL